MILQCMNIIVWDISSLVAQPYGVELPRGARTSTINRVNIAYENKLRVNKGQGKTPRQHVRTSCSRVDFFSFSVPCFAQFLPIWLYSALSLGP